MPRSPRIHFPGAFYHIMLRGNGGQQIFFSENDYLYFYYLLEESINKFDHKIHAFCLMSNHIHILIQVENTLISKIMHNISFRYAQFINEHQKRKGHVFQGRYKSILVEEDSYLLSLVQYIHLNPVKAQLVNHPDEYKWSSHLAYLQLEHLPWLTKETVLYSLSKDKGIAIQVYQNLMFRN